MTPPLILACPRCATSLRWSEDNPWRPFCSERCKLIDLGDWADEKHRIASSPLSSLDDQSLD